MQAHSIGDYVLADGAYDARNTVVKASAPASDHLPVIASMRVRKKGGSGRGSPDIRAAWTAALL